MKKKDKAAAKSWFNDDPPKKSDKTPDNWIKVTNLGEHNILGFPITLIHVGKSSAEEAEEAAREGGDVWPRPEG